MVVDDVVVVVVVVVVKRLKMGLFRLWLGF